MIQTTLDTNEYQEFSYIDKNSTLDVIKFLQYRIARHIDLIENRVYSIENNVRHTNIIEVDLEVIKSRKNKIDELKEIIEFLENL